MIPRIPANAPPPPIKWWGNVFYRCWAGPAGRAWQQLVIVIRLPWWREMPGTEPDFPFAPVHTGRLEQLMIAWRTREGWYAGWRAV